MQKAASPSSSDCSSGAATASSGVTASSSAPLVREGTSSLTASAFFRLVSYMFSTILSYPQQLGSSEPSGDFGGIPRTAH